MITQDRLKELFDYNSETGNLIWKIQPRGRWKLKGKAAGTTSSNGYMQITADCHIYMAHRLVWLWHYGTFLKNDIDHINGNRNDNRVENLREATRSENNQNRKKVTKQNKIGFVGVSTHKNGGEKKYFARIQLNGKQYSCGYYATPEEAHAAYIAKKKELHPFYKID